MIKKEDTPIRISRRTYEEKHKEVMSILEWAKENDLLHFGICEFIISQKWIEYKELKEKGGGTFDTTELL